MEDATQLPFLTSTEYSSTKETILLESQALAALLTRVAPSHDPDQINKERRQPLALRDAFIWDL